ncbi:S-layer homology domain-containing protein [Schinkia azotoformans]|uniref:S-layer homology domain-containing protein n=1 Tax=Schinkia azotoformans TaxID=1454 RepID=UPI002E21A733|nr:S-layer homology domain-containing protein [Schinkia azotoformans]
MNKRYRLLLFFLIAVFLFNNSVDAAKFEKLSIPLEQLRTNKSVNIQDKDGNVTKVTYVQENEKEIVLNLLTDVSKNITISKLPIKKFKDVSGHWAENDIYKLASMGYIAGYPDDTFRPNKEITRAEFATLFSRIVDQEKSAIFMLTFSDVKEEEWFSGSISALVQRGNIKKNDYGSYIQPNEPITREEVAKWIAPEIKKVSESGNDFKDFETIQYHEEVKIASQAGLIKGFVDGTFRPKNYTTRAEATAILLRFLELK